MHMFVGSFNRFKNGRERVSCHFGHMEKYCSYVINLDFGFSFIT